MKVFSIATLIALSALINGSSAVKWCGCYGKIANPEFWEPADVWLRHASAECCHIATNKGLAEGGSWFGLTASNWCVAEGDQADKFKRCCGANGYCK